MAQPADPDQLLIAARAGDRAALVDLLTHFAARIRGRIAPKIPAYLQSSVDADDILQVTHTEAFLRLSRFKEGDSHAFFAWLSRLADNNLIDAVRALEADKRPDPRNRVGAPKGREDSMAALVELLGVTHTTPSVVAMRGEAGLILEDAIQNLPPAYAKVVRDCDLAGRPVPEVAAELGRSPGAVFMLRARAHERLRELLGPSARFFSTPA